SCAFSTVIRRPRDATTLPPTVSWRGAAALLRRGFAGCGLPGGIPVGLFVQTGVKVGHDLDRVADPGIELGELFPSAVDLGAQPLVFLLERLRLVPEAVVLLLDRLGFGLEPLVRLERAAHGVHAAVYRLTPRARFVRRGRDRGCG